MNTKSSTKADAQQVWLITGTSRGFGAEIAKSALAAGDIVAGTARRPEDVTKSLGKSDRLLAVKMDVTDPESVRAGVETVIAQFGRIDVLVNNAGYGLLGSIEEASPKEVEGVFRTNVFGLLNVTRAVLPHMRSRHSGRLIHFSSIGGYESHVGWGIYCATKFAVEAISEALSAELAPLGIYSTVVEPGFFRTDFLDASSLKRTARVIDDYAETVGKMRAFAADNNHQQPNDPTKLGSAIVRIAHTEKPPIRLPLGPDTVAVIEKKNAFVEAELEQWRSLATSTGF